MPRPQHPVSQEQLAANRANAAHSTGPRTPQGKARSAQNARKHGFTASTFAVVRLEDLHEVADLKDDLLAVYQPVNSQELFAIERIALTQQALLRAARLETGLFTTCLNQSLDSAGNPVVLINEKLAGDGDIEITRAQNRNYLLADGFHRMARQCNSWALALRYQAQAERHYRRAVAETNPPPPKSPLLHPAGSPRPPAPGPWLAPRYLSHYPKPMPAFAILLVYDTGTRRAASSPPSCPYATGLVLISFKPNWKGRPPRGAHWARRAFLLLSR